MTQSVRRLTARPAESEHPVTEINHYQEQQSLRKQPLFKKDSGILPLKEKKT
jgi:hypothetical protein